MDQPFDYSIIDAILKEHPSESIIAILQSIQEHYRYLPSEIFPYLADKLNTSEARV